jgi:hypothetical protein
MNVYKIDHPQDKEQPFKAEKISKLKNIVRIASSFTHFLALGREEIPPLKMWTHIQVA